jgi:hypothetical protein
LQVQQQDAVIHELFAGKSHVFQARNTQDGEQDQIIDIHEIAGRT